jgi:dTDP-4-amino-4,6-dideoxygalactose transaminase
MKKYPLFNINNYIIDTSKFSHILHDAIENELEKEFAEYVGAKYACIANSASSLLSLCAIAIGKLGEALNNYPVRIPSMIPVVVPNLINNAGIFWVWTDDVDWVGSSYVLYDTKELLSEYGAEESSFKIIDSAQEVRRNQFKEDAQDADLMVFSLYPTKPVGGMDGGVLVSNDKEKVDWFRTACHLGVSNKSLEDGSWKRTLEFPGFKYHPNSSQCYVALNNLRKLDEKNKKLDIIKQKYNSEFGLNNSSRHLYRIDVEDRERFQKKMADFGIDTGIHYNPAHLEKCFQDTPACEILEKTTKKSTTTVSIPFNESLEEEGVDEIIKRIKENT